MGAVFDESDEADLWIGAVAAAGAGSAEGGLDRRIVGDMLELMYAHKGLGLAAPQVAVPITPLAAFRMPVEERLLR